MSGDARQERQLRFTGPCHGCAFQHRDYVDSVCLCRLLFYGKYGVFRRNVDGTGLETLASGLSALVQALSVDHNNRVCWGQVGRVNGLFSI